MKISQKTIEEVANVAYSLNRQRDEYYEAFQYLQSRVPLMLNSDSIEDIIEQLAHENIIDALKKVKQGIPPGY